MFVHLRLHTEFSIADGTNRIDEIVEQAAADHQPALAVTDLNNLYGAIKFYKAARSAGVKPIIGTELLLQGLAKDPAVFAKVVVLVQNRQGYLNLCELLSRAWTRNVSKTHAVCKLDWMAERGEGLIVLSGAQAGPVGQALLQGDEARASEAALALASVFPHRFYIELQRAGRADDEAHVAAAVQLAGRLSLPVVATHPVQFRSEDDYEAHEARVCISDGEILGNPRRVRRFTREQYFKSQAQMAQLFADVPSAVANTLEIAKRCNLVLELNKPHLPVFPTPNGMPVEEYFRFASHEGLKERMLQLYPDAAERDKQLPRYVERLEFEIGTILKMKFPGYFLIVGDFINWAKANGCPVGPGRGSGAGSLVAYSMKITDLDPLQYEGTHAELRHRAQRLDKAARKMIELHQSRDVGGGDTPIDLQPRIQALHKEAQATREFLAREQPRRNRQGKELKSNVTDNDSAKMATSKGVIQGYAAQAAVDASCQGNRGRRRYGLGLGAGDAGAHDRAQRRRSRTAHRDHRRCGLSQRGQPCAAASTQHCSDGGRRPDAQEG